MMDLRASDKADIFNQPYSYIDSGSKGEMPNLFNDIFKLCH